MNPILAALLAIKEERKWSGTITLNWKDGHVVAFEVAEKTRLDGRPAA